MDFLLEDVFTLGGIGGDFFSDCIGISDVDAVVRAMDAKLLSRLIPSLLSTPIVCIWELEFNLSDCDATGLILVDVDAALGLARFAMATSSDASPMISSNSFDVFSTDTVPSSWLFSSKNV
jgi:hypothetical protein